MKPKLLTLFPVLLLIFACNATHRQDPIRDVIKPLRLAAGKTDSMLVSDLFFAHEYTLDFQDNPDIDLTWHPEKRILILQPDAGFEGTTTIDFRYHDELLSIPVIVEKKQRHRFSYRPPHKPKSLTLFGSFNSWNRSDIRMLDETGAGEYSVEIELDPGRYEYRFFMDEKEFPDPNNPLKVLNPFGEYNSLLIVEPRFPHRAELHILGMTAGADTTTLQFMYSHEKQPGPLQPGDILALLNNSRLAPELISLEGNRISIRLPKTLTRGRKSLRLNANQNGQSTLFLTVPMQDGVPLRSPEHHFTWQDAIIYSVMIDRFHDGDPDNTRPVDDPRVKPKANYHGGDLQGIIDKLEQGYFDSLGVNVLWLSPVVRNTDKAWQEYPPPREFFAAYHGYWPVDSYSVDPRFGDLELLRKLVRTAHERGIRVLLDFIANHVHKDHPFFREHRDWFGTVDLPDGRKNIRLWDEHRLTTWFEPYLPSFDYQNSDEALQVMTDNALWWLRETGVDGFRQDAVKHIPNRFWRTLTRKIRLHIDPHREVPVYQIGETFGGYDLVSSYVNPGQLDAQFDFNLFDPAKRTFLSRDGHFRELAAGIQKTFTVYGMNHLMGNIMDSHDQVRYMAFADGDITLTTPDAVEVGWHNPPQVDDPTSYRRARLYLTWLFTIPGVPTLYYGDEIGMTGAADPDNRRPMRFGEQLNEHEREMWQKVARLVHIRRQHSALRHGDFHILHAEKHTLAYIRSDVYERIIVVLNKSKQQQDVAFSLPEFYGVQQAENLLDGERYALADNNLRLTVAPESGIILRAE